MIWMKQLLRYPCAIQQKRTERRYRKQHSCGAVWMLHDVYEDGMKPEEAFIATSKKNFISLLDAIDGRVRPLHRYQDILNMERGDVVLTFDDIFQSAYQNAIPVLRQRKIPYVAFIATGLVGKSGYVTKEQLEDLAADPLCTIGAHSVTHQMYRFAPGAFPEEAKTSGRALEAELFAFPYGSIYACSRRNRRDLERCGLFSCGFSTLNCDLTKDNRKDRFFLPRRNVNDRFAEGIAGAVADKEAK